MREGQGGINLLSGAGRIAERGLRDSISYQDVGGNIGRTEVDLRNFVSGSPVAAKTAFKIDGLASFYRGGIGPGEGVFQSGASQKCRVAKSSHTLDQDRCDGAGSPHPSWHSCHARTGQGEGSKRGRISAFIWPSFGPSDAKSRGILVICNAAGDESRHERISRLKR